MCQCKLWLLSVVFASFSVFSVIPFNVDSSNYAIYQVPDASSMFGFSVAVHKETGNGWLIVGAPEAQSAYQRNTYRGGAVYKCPADRDGNCQEIRFDTSKGDNYDTHGNQMDNKTEQWFGATVSGSGSPDGPVVACAPRYTWYPKKRTRRDPVGTCYVSNGKFDHIEEYSPCRTFLWGYHRQGSCQAGFSAAINSVGDRLFIGAPGSWYWQGQMYSIDAHATFEFKPRLFAGTYGSQGQVHQQNLATRPAVFSTTEGTERDDDSYMGYSTIVGDFQGDGEQGIAVGMPRGNYLKGKVLLFTWNLTNFLHHFTSDQLGSYYGYALAASDVDGDGKVDLIIGAPMYTVQNNEGKYDVGRVYVIYHQSDKGKFVANYIIDGFKSKSRFGQALASLGDINQDGYGDFAIGAPYDGPNERGAVYIYHGSKNGVRKKYSQVIYAEDVVRGPSSLYTFGFSITGGLDMDGNDYPDMAVGAYLSNTAFFFRSRPVVIVEAFVKFLTEKKEVDIKVPTYTLRNGPRAVRTEIDFCVKYHGKGIPSAIDLNLQYILDSKKTAQPRMGFVDFEGLSVLNDTIRIYKDRPDFCKRQQVYVLSDIRDKLTSLVAEVKYWMNEDSSFTLNRNPRSVLAPVLDLNSPPSRKDSISVHKECGDDNICIPNLSLTVKPSVDKYLLGSKEDMFFDVLVSNTGEDSFETTLEVKYPDNVFYNNIKEDKVESHVLCNTYGKTLKCEIGNPIPKGKVVAFKIFWQPKYKVGMAPTYDFIMSVNSTNQEEKFTLGDNNRNVSVGIWSNSRLQIEGKSHPGEIFFNSSSYTADISHQAFNTPPANRLPEDVIGPQVIHVYYLHNDGPATIEETEVFFAWPAYLSGSDFLYLVEPPHFSPSHNVQCGVIPANYRNFEIEISKKSIWERLNIIVEESRIAGAVSGKVGSTVGGGIAKTEESLNTAVGSSGDSSNVQKHRHNISSSGTMNLDNNGLSSWNTTSNYTSGGITHTIYSNQTHFRNATGVYVTSTGQLVGSGGSYWQGQGQGLGLGQGHTQGGQSGKPKNVTIKYSSSGKQTNAGSTLNNNSKIVIDGRKYQQEIIGGKQFVYRCLKRVNGREEEVDCGPDFTLPSVNKTWLLEQSGGQQYNNMQFRCFEEINGRYQPIECGTQFITGLSEGQLQGSGTAGGGQFNVNIVHKCKEIVNGRESEIPCDRNGLPQFNSSRYQTQFGGNFRQVGSGVNVIHECYQTVNGVQYKVDCNSFPNWQQERNYQQSGESSFKQEKHDSAAQEQHARYDEERIKEERQRAEYEKQRADYERRRAEYERQRQLYHQQQQQQQHQHGQQNNGEQYSYQGGTTQQGSGQYSYQGGSTGSSQHNYQGGTSQSHGGQYHYQGGSSSSSGSGTQTQGSSQGSQGGSDQYHYHGSGTQTQGSSSGAAGEENESGSYYYDEDEEEGDGKAISGYIDTTNSLNTQNQASQGRRDPKTYGTYDESRHREASSQSGAGGPAVGNGFSVTTLDLGNLGGSNQGQNGNAGSTLVQSGSSGSGRQEWHGERHWSETRPVTQTYQNTVVERDNVPTDRPTSKNRFYGRKKRQLDDHPSIAEISNLIKCNSVQCIYMRCTISGLEKDEQVSIALRARVNARVLRNVTSSEPLSFSSVMAARINKLPYIGTPTEQVLHTHEIFTSVSKSETEIKTDVVPLWVVVLSAVAGTIILLLLVFLLYKVGFFKRNRPSSAPERQPLNRNGYHHGDEAL